ncbi:FG-GAP-like repeat-containing protein [Tunicatimonas pelagia]|uniref:FG-GAP-like repeat-containing protein n=1 Tax=Tunicatimonas pelagia TaxID=931531 RepID=UPI0026670E95|nr:FG-GAP-like repeat-containing protein [Tunicatimonas pelagia]WKN43778.1 FG-GAP-like repeat-containing protein [Tunicatimonas pelagia]
MKKTPNLTYIILLALALLSFVGYAQEIELDEQWVFENEGENREDEITRVVTDSQGNVYVSGWFSGTINLDPNGTNSGRLTAVDGNADPDDVNADMFVAKYNSDGALLNIRQLDYKGFNDVARSIALSSDESLLYVVGHARGEVGDDVDIYLASLTTSDLVVQKVIQSSSPENERGQNVAVHSNGNVYITGYYEKSVELFSGSFNPPVSPFSDNAPQDGLFVLVFDKDLNGLVDSGVAKGMGIVRSQGMDIDNQGNVYLAGEFSNNLSFPGANTEASQGARDIFCAKYNLGSNEFDFAFSLGSNSNSDDRSRSLVILDNSFYITGDFRNTMDFDPASAEAASIKTVASDYDFFLARYTLNGAYQNVYQVGGRGGSDGRSFEQGYDIAVHNNLLHVVGRITSITPDVGDERFFDEIANNDEADAFLAIFPPDISAPTFVERYGRDRFDYALALGITNAGDIFIGGFTDWSGRNDGVALKNSYLVKFEAEQEGATGVIVSEQLSAQTLESTTLGGRDATMADFDLDGDLDVAVAFKLGSAVRWYPNNNGSFNTGIPLQNNLPGPRAVSSANFDGTNGPDIALTDDPSSGSELRWYQNQGGGNFPAPQTITTNYAGSSDVLAEDIDQDGSPDIILTNFFTQNIIFFKNNGGEFPEEKEIDETAGRPRVLEAGNLDGDEQGLPDLLVVIRDKDAEEGGNDEDGVQWYRNLGSGNFAAPVVIANNTQVDNPRAASIADFDGDQDLDVVVVSNDGGNVTLIRNQGNGDFATPQNVGTAAKPFAVDATDLDGDGDIDILVGSENDGDAADNGTLTWFKNNGAAAFTKETLVTVPKGQPNTIVTEDIDNDGDQDIIVAFGEDGEFGLASANVLLSLTNNIQSAPQPLILDRSANQGNSGDAVRLYGGNFGSVIGTAQVFFGENEAVVEKVFAEGTQLWVTVPDLEDDFYDIIVRLPNENVAVSQNFLVGEEPIEPTITQVNPLSNVVAGTEVIIQGFGFGSNPTVKIGETTITVDSINAEGSFIRILVPEIPAGEYDVLVTPEGGTEITFDDKISIIEPQAPFISQVVPLQGVTAGTEVVIQGFGFGSNPTVGIGETTVNVNNVNAEGTTIRITAPDIPAGDYDVKVTPEGGTEIIFEDKISIIIDDGGDPSVSSVTPKQGIVGAQVTITGTQLGEVGVLFGNEAAIPTEQTATNVVFLVPNTAIVGQIYPISISYGEVVDSVASFEVVDVEDTTLPEIVPETIITTYRDGDDIIFTINANDESGIDEESVKLFYRKVGDQNLAEQEMVVQENGSYSTTLSVSDLSSLLGDDGVGIEYYFAVTDRAGNTATTERKIINREFTSLSLLRVSAIANPENPQQLDYQMIGIPLQPQSVSGQLTELGEFKSDNTGNWALYRYSSSNNTYEQFERNEFTNFAPGVGYMFAYRNFDSTIVLNGQTVGLTGNTFPITINQEFTLISNPYLSDIDWGAVIEFNEGLGIIAEGAIKKELLKWKHGQGWLPGETQLRPFEGAFVEATGITGSVTLQVPVSPAARLDAGIRKNTFSQDLSSSAWLVPFTLESGQQSYELGGVGMHPEAKINGDRFDALVPPRFIEYLDISFARRDNFNSSFTQDVVPTQNAFVWDFEVAASSGSAITLRWDNTQFGNSDYQLMLLDLESLVKTDLRSVSSYGFVANRGRRFQLFYGTSRDIEEAMQPDRFSVGTPYPNPTSSSLAIPVSVPDTKADVRLKIFNVTGQQVADQSYSLTEGYHNLQWEGTDIDNQRVPPGLYIYRVQQNSESTFSGKFVVQ